MKLKLLYTETLGNKADIHKYKRMSMPDHVVMDPNSFTMTTGTGMISNKLSKKMKMGKAGKQHDVLWTPTGYPIPRKHRHRQYMRLQH